MNERQVWIAEAGLVIVRYGWQADIGRYWLTGRLWPVAIDLVFGISA
jgi:hypothetical protein